MVGDEGIKGWDSNFYGGFWVGNGVIGGVHIMVNEQIACSGLYTWLVGRFFNNWMDFEAANSIQTSFCCWLGIQASISIGKKVGVGREVHH